MLKLGIIGCGAIGRDVATAVNDMPEISHLFLFDKIEEKAVAIARISEKASSVPVDELIEHSDVVFEAASQQAVYDYAEKIIDAKKDMIIMTIGALYDDDFRMRLVEKAKKRGCKIYLPSGAVAGLDGVKAASIGGLDSVTLVTTKSPESLGKDLNRRAIIFEGNARDAIRHLPKNINVAACLSLAGVGFEETKVKVVTDPVVRSNSHKILAHGKFGRLRAEVENMPNPNNPKSSYLASLSAIAVIKKIVNPLQIGI